MGRYRRIGERVMINGKPYRVEFVNSCRARCMPVGKRVVSYMDSRTGRQVSFRAADGRPVNIAATTE